MSQERLNNFMLLTIYKEWLDGLNLIATANEFSDNNDERNLVFRTFKIQDYMYRSK